MGQQDVFAPTGAGSVIAHADGLSLAELFQALAARGERLSDPAALHVGVAMLEALAHAHGHTDGAGARSPIVHGSLDPSAVLLGKDGSVRIDGLSGARTEALAIGKPDAARGITSNAEKADVRAAGLVLWKLLTGRDAFPPIEPLARARPDLPREISAAVGAAIDAYGAKRAVSCAEVAAWIRKVAKFSEGRDEIVKRVGVFAPPVPAISAFALPAAPPAPPPTHFAATQFAASPAGGPAFPRPPMATPPLAAPPMPPPAARPHATTQLGMPPLGAMPMGAPPIGASPLGATQLGPSPIEAMPVAPLVAPPLGAAIPTDAMSPAFPPVATPMDFESSPMDVTGDVVTSDSTRLPLQGWTVRLAPIAQRVLSVGHGLPRTGAARIRSSLAVLQTTFAERFPKADTFVQKNRRAVVATGAGIGALTFVTLVIAAFRGGSHPHSDSPSPRTVAASPAPPVAADLPITFVTFPSPRSRGRANVATEPPSPPPVAPPASPAAAPADNGAAPSSASKVAAAAVAEAPHPEPQAPAYAIPGGSKAPPPPPKGFGYVTVHSSIKYAFIYVQLYRYGQVEHRLTVRCGKRFLSIGVPKATGGEPTWFAPSRYVDVPCGGAVEVEMMPQWISGTK